MDEKVNYIDIAVRKRGFTGLCELEYAEITDDCCVITCPLRPELLNPNGIAHGGLIATLTDVASGSLALQLDRCEREICTQSCNIHYLRPGTGKVLTARAHLIRKGGRVCVVQADCFNDSGVLVATSIYEIAYLGNTP